MVALDEQLHHPLAHGINSGTTAQSGRCPGGQSVLPVQSVDAFVSLSLRGANNDVYTPYYVWGPNCAALVPGTPQAGGIPFGKTGYWSDGRGPAVPDKLFNNLATEGINFQLGSGVTITTAQGSTTVTFQK